MHLKMVLFTCLFISSFHGLGQGSPPTFLIEQIRVIGARRVSENIIVSESRLVKDAAYSEKQLRYAIQKINRLPFILDVQFSLARGSERGKYQLIITVRETTLLFFNAETAVTVFDGDRERFEHESLSAGLRWFGGKASVFFLAFSPNVTWLTDAEKAPAYAFGYSNYNLFRRNIFFNLTLHYVEDQVFSFSLEDNMVTTFTSPIAPELNISIPIKGNHWVKSSWNFNEFESRTDAPDEPLPSDMTNLSNRHFLAFWEYNSTNDNLIPTSGTLNQLGYDYTYSTSRTFAENALAEGVQARQIFYNYSKFKELGPRRSYFYGSSLSFTRNKERAGGSLDERRSEVYSASIKTGYALDLWNRRKMERFGDFRFEVNGGAGRLFGGGADALADQTIYFVESNLTFRNRIGLFKLSIRYSGSD